VLTLGPVDESGDPSVALRAMEGKLRMVDDLPAMLRLLAQASITLQAG
jgi:hypothetical protein